MTPKMKKNKIFVVKAGENRNSDLILSFHRTNSGAKQAIEKYKEDSAHSEFWIEEEELEE